MKYFFVLLLILIIASCTSEKVKPKIIPGIKTEELPSQESWNSKITFSDSGKIKAVLIAGHIKVFEQAKETLLDSNVTVYFYDKSENQTTTLTSKRGRVDDKTNDLYAIDSVVAVNDSGVVIKTQEMMWRNKDKKIVSDKYVAITSPTEVIEGYGFESDQQLKNYVIYNVTYITRRDSL